MWWSESRESESLGYSERLRIWHIGRQHRRWRKSVGMIRTLTLHQAKYESAALLSVFSDRLTRVTWHNNERQRHGHESFYCRSRWTASILIGFSRVPKSGQHFKKATSSTVYRLRDFESTSVSPFTRVKTFSSVSTLCQVRVTYYRACSEATNILTLLIGRVKKPLIEGLRRWESRGCCALHRTGAFFVPKKVQKKNRGKKMKF